MKKLLTLILLSFFVSVSYATKSIELKEDQFYVISGTFDNTMQEDFTKKVISLGKKSKMTVFIDSPGGSVQALDSMIAMVDGYEVELTCIARMAGSAAFAFFERCDKRYVTKDALLVAHNGSFNIQEMRFQDFIASVEMIKSWKESIDKKMSYKLNISLKEYQEKIANADWMLTPDMSLKYNAADEIVDVSCEDSLKDKEDIVVKKVNVMFMQSEVEIVTPKCPLIRPRVKRNN